MTSTTQKSTLSYVSHWYAIRPFTQAKMRRVVDLFCQNGVSYLRPYSVRLSREGLASGDRAQKGFEHDVYDIGLTAKHETTLVFFFCAENELRGELRQALFGEGIIYADSINGRWLPSIIPQEQIVQFLRVLSVGGRYRILDNAAELLQRGQRVEVTGGKYIGMKGVVYRIQRHKHFIIRLNVGCAVMLDYVPSVFLRSLSDEQPADDSYDMPDGTDLNHVIATLAVNMRLLPTVKTCDVTFDQLEASLTALEQIRLLRTKIDNFDIRLGLGIGCEDQKSELDSMIADLQQAVAAHPLSASSETTTLPAADAIAQLCKMIG